MSHLERLVQPVQFKGVHIAMLAVVLAGGCGHQSFAPTEKATAVSLQGYPAAEYDLTTRNGDLGEVKVWSSGAEGMQIRGKTRTVVHVAFEIENSSNEAIVLDTGELRLESVAVDDMVLENVRVTEVVGPREIPPGAAGRVDALFAMPRGIDEDEIGAFRVRWALQDEDARYTQWTPFSDLVPYAYAGPNRYGPYYDPYWSGAFPPPLFVASYRYGPGYPYGYPYGYPFWW